MQASRFVRIIVLSVFILSLSAFVAYRAGIFDSNAPKQITSYADGDLNIPEDHPRDTVPTIDSTPPRVIMSSSKSIIMPKNYDYIKAPDVKVKKKDKDKKKKKDKNAGTDTSKVQPTIMYGSKSGMIIPRKKDTLTKDR